MKPLTRMRRGVASSAARSLFLPTASLSRMSTCLPAIRPGDSAAAAVVENSTYSPSRTSGRNIDRPTNGIGMLARVNGAFSSSKR